MIKQIKDLTIIEVLKICSSHSDCIGCPLDSCNKRCYCAYLNDPKGAKKLPKKYLSKKILLFE